MSLASLGRELAALQEGLDEFRLARESLAFCFEVYQRYAAGAEGDEHMDKDKALAQLLDSIERMLAV